MAWQRCAAHDDVWNDCVLPVQVGGQSIALYNIAGTIYATSDICTHEHAHLSDGYIEGECIECPLHGALFHVPTGEVRGGPVTVALKTFPVRVEGSDVLIDVEASNTDAPEASRASSCA